MTKLPNRTEIAKNQQPNLRKRAVYKTSKYIIVKENLKKPLNYEIYPAIKVLEKAGKIKNGKIII